MEHVVKTRNTVYNKIPSMIKLLIAAAIICSFSPFWPMHILFFFNLIYLFIFACAVFTAATGFFSGCGEWGLL